MSHLAQNYLHTLLHSHTKRLQIVAVSYGDRTPRIASFNKQSTFGPSFGRILMGKASKSALRPAKGKPEADVEAFPIRIKRKRCPKVPALLKPATGWFLSTETPPQKHRLQNSARRVGNKAGNPQKTTKNQENPQKLRDPAPA